LGVDDGIKPFRIGRRDGDADPALALDGNAGVGFLPGQAAVGRFENAAARAVRRRIDAPRRTPRVPQHAVNDPGIRRVNANVDSADIVVLEKDLLPRPAAVRGAIDPTVRIWPVDMSEGRDKNDVRISGIDIDAADLPCVLETE